MKNIWSYVVLSLAVSCTVYSCSDNDKGDAKDIDNEILDPSSSLNTVFDGKIFSIPSPVQTSMLIKDLDIPFNPNLTNSTDNLSSYNTAYSQALNLGIYGTDLGYVSLYNQSSLSVRYLAAVQKTTESLGLNAAFDKDFIKRFENNLANQDSMTIIVSEAFRKADNFLKNTNRKAISALILTGGWIESMYFACELNALKSSQKVIERIGEQQLTLNTLIELMKEYNENNQNDELIQDLKDLQFYFNKVEFNYTYKPPTTNAKEKTTTLNHDLTVQIDTDILNQITMKIRSVRQKIIA